MPADGMTSIDALAALSAPFADGQISWRIGHTTKDKSKGMALAYIDARDVMERLDSVCGVGNWQDHYVETPKGRILCSLSVRINGEWIEKTDGAGDSDVESEKGAISDALKRAAVKWGVGRYLYNIDSPWVEVEEFGKSVRMKANERRKLDKCHHDYVRNNFQPSNAGAPDAGQHEQPKAQQEAGVEASPASTPVQTMSKGDARNDFKDLQEDMRRITSLRDLRAWEKLNGSRIDMQPADWAAQLNEQYNELETGLIDLEGKPFRLEIDTCANLAALRMWGIESVARMDGLADEVKANVRGHYIKRGEALTYLAKTSAAANAAFQEQRH